MFTKQEDLRDRVNELSEWFLNTFSDDLSSVIGEGTEQELILYFLEKDGDRFEMHFSVEDVLNGKALEEQKELYLRASEEHGN